MRALSRHFRGGLVSRRRRAYEEGRLPRIRKRAEVDRVLKTLMGTDGVVYSKPCLARTETVVDDLGRSAIALPAPTAACWVSMGNRWT